MWETINEVLAAIDDFVWGVPLIVLILSGGLLLTIRTKVLQVRHLPLESHMGLSAFFHGKTRFA